MSIFNNRGRKKILGYKLSEVCVNTYYGYTRYEESSEFYKTKDEAISSKELRLHSWSEVYDGDFDVLAKLCDEPELSVFISRAINTDHVREIRMTISEIYDYS